MKRALIVFVLAIVHFVLSFSFFLLSFGGGMSRFDAAGETSIGERIIDALAYVLLFPLVQLAVRIGGGWLNGFFGYVPFILNSLLWAALLYYLINFFVLRRRRSIEPAH